MNRKKIAVRVIKEELSGFGFHQNGNEWFLGSDEVVFVLALQKSSFDDFLCWHLHLLLISDYQNSQRKGMSYSNKT